MNALPSQTDILSTPDFGLLLLCSEFMGEDRFRELLESMPRGEVPDGKNVKGDDYHEP